MNGIVHLPTLNDGAVHLAGDRIQEFSARVGRDWPFPADETIGDTRCALIWPRPKPESEDERTGCFMVAVMSAGGKLVLVTHEPFWLASSVLAGRTFKEGAASMIAQMHAAGVRCIVIDARDRLHCATWCDAIQRDTSCRHIMPQYDCVTDAEVARGVLAEMAANVIGPGDVLVEAETAALKGRMTQATTAASMLAWSYRFTVAARVQRTAEAWTIW